MKHDLRISLRAALAAAAAVAAFAVPASAQTNPWTVVFSSERAAVDFGPSDGIWSTATVTTMWSRPEMGGWAVTGQRQERGGTADVALGGRAFRHAGAWTFLGGAAATPNSHFLPAATAEAEISRRLGTVVASGGYRYLGFNAVDLHQIQPALTWYHPRGELEGRLYVTRNVTVPRTTSTVLARASFAFSSRLRVNGGAAVGDRIFDVASLPYGSARARLGFGEVRVGMTSHDFIQAGVTIAHEAPSFDYRSFTVEYRRVF